MTRRVITVYLGMSCVHSFERVRTQQQYNFQENCVKFKYNNVKSQPACMYDKIHDARQNKHINLQ